MNMLNTLDIGVPANDDQKSSRLGFIAQFLASFEQDQLQHYQKFRPQLPPSLREQLIQKMGLRYDPFLTSVTEGEVDVGFGTIYVDSTPPLLERLEKSINTIMLADYGMGKTASCTALEYYIRNTTGNTLSVSYRPKISVLQQNPGHSRLETHLYSISQEMVTDLLIQFIERIEEHRGEISSAEEAAVRRLAASMSPAFRRLLQKLDRNSIQDGAFWAGIRPVVRYVAMTPKWKKLLNILLENLHQTHHLTWEQVIDEAIVLGFRRVYLLIDAVDENGITPEEVHEAMHPLFNVISDLEKKFVFIKCFLPLELERLFYTRYEKQFQRLTAIPEIITIGGRSVKELQQIIHERLQAASNTTTSCQSLDWFRHQEIQTSIEEQLALLANGFPRRMIDLTSKFLQFHSTHGFRDNGRLWLTGAEWQEFLETVQDPL